MKVGGLAQAQKLRTLAYSYYVIAILTFRLKGPHVRWWVCRISLISDKIAHCWYNIVA